MGYVVIGIHTAFAEDDVAHIVNQAKVGTIICSSEFSEKFLNVAKLCPSLKNIVQMSELIPEKVVR